MRAFRFLHAADLHVDSPFRGLSSLPAAIRDRIMDSTFAALDKMVEVAIAENIDFIVLSGDIYDLADRSLRAQLQFQAAMQRLSAESIQVFVIHGNHDPLDGARITLDFPDHVYFFHAEDVQRKSAYDRHGNEVAHVYGISYPTAAVFDNLVPKYQVENSQMFNIALLHCNLDGSGDHERYAPCTKEELLRSGMDYWALGHIHTRQVVHNEPAIVYPGNLQGRSVRELGAKGCYVVDVSESGQVSLTFHATDAIRWFHERISIESLDSVQDLADSLEDLVDQVREAAEHRPAIMRVTLEGRGELHHVLQRDAELAELTDFVCARQLQLAEQDEAFPFVWLERIQLQTGSAIRYDQLLQQESFLGDLLRISQAKLSNEEQLQQFAEQALTSLLNHRQAGKYIKSMTLEDQRAWLKQAEELAVHLLHEDVEQLR